MSKLILKEIMFYEESIFRLLRLVKIFIIDFKESMQNNF